MHNEKREENESVYCVMVQTKLPQSKVQELVKDIEHLQLDREDLRDDLRESLHHFLMYNNENDEIPFEEKDRVFASHSVIDAFLKKYL